MRQPHWTTEETERLHDLYASGDKCCLPWPQVASDLNDEFENNRSIVACQVRLYKTIKPKSLEAVEKAGKV